MLLSTANAGPRNLESVRTPDLLPQGLRDDAKNLIDLLESYYSYLNSDDMPTREIGSISSLKDIDVVSSKYINQIEELIGKSVPNSKVLNRVELYKIIVKYYNTRGSEDSIHTFFKIFFDEIVEIVYPKDSLFDLSGGDWSWSDDDVLEDTTHEVLIRAVADQINVILGGLEYSALSTDGSGQLISIEYKAEVDGQYETLVDYSNGVTTVTPGNKSRLTISSTALNDGTTTYDIPSILYFTGFGVDDKPTYSDQSNYTEVFYGSTTRIEWDGTNWLFTLGSSQGDLFTFYSSEDVADPTLVTTWSNAWTGLVAGSIDNISFGLTTNGQIFNALFNTAGFNNDVLIRADILSNDWTANYEVTPRTYLSSNPLPNDAPVGQFAIMNGGFLRPFIFGQATLVNGLVVWQKYSYILEYKYGDNRSFISDNRKLFDGNYWQDYSYVIKSDLDATAWYDEYRKFVHPAGLKMFSAIAIEVVSRNKWTEEVNYESSDSLNDFSWLRALIPPSVYNDASIGYHTPKFQPGYLREKILRYVITYLLPGNHDTNLLRLVLLSFQYITPAINVQTSYVRTQYQGSEKFIDDCKVSEGWLSKTVGGASEEYSIINKDKIYNISSYVNPKPTTLDGVAYYLFDSSTARDAILPYNKIGPMTNAITGAGALDVTTYSSSTTQYGGGPAVVNNAGFPFYSDGQIDYIYFGGNTSRIFFNPVVSIPTSSWEVTGTSNGVFAAKRNSNNAVRFAGHGIDSNSPNAPAGYLVGTYLLPGFSTQAVIDEAKQTLINKGAPAQISDLVSHWAYREDIVEIDSNMYDTSQVTSLDSFCLQCFNLTKVNSFNITNVLTFQYAWQNCTSLVNFPENFFDNWNATPAGLCFNGAWIGCTSLSATSVENILNSIDFSGVTISAGITESSRRIIITYDTNTGTPDIATTVSSLQSKNWVVVLNGVTQ